MTPEEVSELQHYIKTHSLKGTFAVVKLWPHLTVAEHENIKRIQRTASDLKLACMVINPYGEIEESPGTYMNKDAIDFVLHLHFASPKAFDCYSILALWNPPDFHYQLGYRKSVLNMMSHDDFLSSGSPWADDQIKRLTSEEAIGPSEQFALYNSIGSPFLQPGIGEAKLFYVGINWEKLGERKKRHSKLLRQLDNENNIKIFGPKIFHDVEIWKGFKNYAGEIPFDGFSIIQKISECGVGLSLSSDAHLEAEMPSNRIFECCAAGVPIISDRNGFVLKHFGDSVLYIDSKKETADVFNQIIKHLDWIRQHPDKAIELAAQSQQIFIQNFELGSCLKNIYFEFQGRREKRELASASAEFLQQAQLICLNLENSKIDFESHITSIRSQELPNLKIHYVIKKEADQFAVSVRKKLADSNLDYILIEVDEDRVQENNFLGRLIYEQVRQDPSLPFCILGSSEKMFAGHLKSLLVVNGGLSESSAPITCSISDYVLHSEDPKDNPIYISDLETNTYKRRHFELGRFLFAIKDEGLKKYLTQLQYFNKEFTSFLIAQSEVAFTNRGSLLVREDNMFDMLQGDAQRELEFINDYTSPRPKYEKARNTSFLEDVRPNHFSLENLNEENKKEIMVELANSLPMPAFAKRMLFGTYRSWLNRKRQR